MPRYKLTIAYDGTGFHGWQKQEPPMPDESEASRRAYEVAATEGLEPGVPGRVALRTVQAIVERAVRRVVREPIELMGASRTDAGVHARGQVAAFTCSPTEPPAQAGGPADTDLDAEISETPAPSHTGWPIARGLDRLVRAINGKLPDDVQVLSAEVVSDDFNPIADCTSKGYSYTLHVSTTRPLWDRRLVQQVWTELNVDRMREAAARLVGEHDFAAFAAAGHGRQSTVRTVYGVRISDGATQRRSDEGGEWARRVRIEISGNGFLYNMVRIIAGTLVEVGRGKMSPDDVSAAIESKDRRNAGPTMPAQGLCLEWIRYPLVRAESAEAKL
ncbi:MAG: tRNA pseudouridine(38-40) synthase TruA [Planctomycetes bacterium]|nr:tRNA pseudouridine(38-40) synthase TruA [Planctomycetota bacterium]